MSDTNNQDTTTGYNFDRFAKANLQPTKETPPMKTPPTVPTSTSDAAIDAQNKERWVPVSTAIRLTGLSESYFYKLMRDGTVRAMTALACPHPVPRGTRRNTLVIDVNAIPIPQHLTKRLRRKLAKGTVSFRTVKPMESRKVGFGESTVGRQRVSRMDQLEEEYLPVRLVASIVGIEPSALYRAAEHEVIPEKALKSIKLSDARKISAFVKHRRADRK
jgi:predicted DNA-binding transcriptional regulator AlpA